jgi:hypothetical protein
MGAIDQVKIDQVESVSGGAAYLASWERELGGGYLDLKLAYTLSRMVSVRVELYQVEIVGS